ncbi:hypothetical protein QO034_06350 [Sedimentitalea sp. JM2-8]|uniref:Uncharacterized protein n=1 Tax=Sedimentitalea xiamensis TaxID=3050037 RepID=A0ABT7FC92_9RHOB|nr:hypothetical protein [Sedimentitalea xiamensis]MDK3072724.1 hypothetical protein [Sedimentitalea xiamensis]
MNALPQPPAPAPDHQSLTPAERIESLVDAIATYQSLLVAANRYGDLINGGDGLPADAELKSLDGMYDASDTAAQMVCHLARASIIDLERAAALLRQNAGRI